MFPRHVNIRRCSQRETILSWCNKWKKLRSISDKNCTGRPKSACNERNEEGVRNVILSSPEISAAKYVSVLGLSKRSTKRMLKRMNFHQHNIAITLELNHQDTINRLAFCRK